MVSNQQSSFYRISAGTIPLTEETYVKREADDKLYEFAKYKQVSSRVCFVLAPRQMGKSSLMVRTAERLRSESFICVLCNLQELGDSIIENTVSAETLYYSLLKVICRGIIKELDLDQKILDTLYINWEKDPKTSPKLKFKFCLIDQILPKIGDKKLIIFIDELQALINWDIQNDFINFIKAISSETDEPKLQKLSFVLLGIARPSDLTTHYNSALNLGEQTQLGYLQGDCQPLWKGLQEVTSEPAKILNLILGWTGGQPFLTQSVCHLVATGGKIRKDTDVEHHIEKLVRNKLIKDWRKQDNLVGLFHLKEIENWFIRVEPKQKREKLHSLQIYKQILQREIRFNFQDLKHWDLLMSGLVIKEDDESLKVANLIYQNVFNEDWVNKQESFLQEDIMVEPIIDTIYNREVFILIDQSASMDTTDPGTRSSRWELLKEEVIGAVKKILEHTGDTPDMKVCQQISISTFNRNKFTNLKPISSSDQVKAIFRENEPGKNTYVTKTLNGCFSEWWGKREKLTAKEVNEGNAKGAFFIIYIDGCFDDTPAFENEVREMCLKVDHPNIFKIIIIGIGPEVNEQYFDELDINLKGNKDMNGNNCNVIVFDLVDTMDDIIELMQRQLGDTSQVREGFSLPDKLDSE